MVTSTPGCRAVCNGKPGEVMDQLEAAFRTLRAQGVSEVRALVISRDPDQLMRLFPSDSLGAMRGVAESFVRSCCAECAVNLAYAK